MSRDYTLKLDVHRERRAGSPLAEVTRTFVEVVTLTLPEDETAGNAWEAVYAPEWGFIDEYFITPRPEVRTQNITFGGTDYVELKSDDGQITYRGTHWHDGDRDGTADPENYAVSIPERNRPVAYVAGTKPRLSAKIRSRGIADSYSMQVRAKINGTIDLPETWCYRTLDGYHTLEATETTQALISAVGFYNAQAGSAFEIKWEFKKGSEWLEMATTKHTVYLVRSAPATSLRQESLFNIACKAANGTNGTDQQVVDAVFSGFEGREVYKVRRSSGEPQEQPMRYAHDDTVETSGGTSYLLSSGKGRCGHWARLFRQAVQVHGISSVDVVELDPDDRSSINSMEIRFYQAFQTHFGYSAFNSGTLSRGLFVVDWDISDPWNPHSPASIPAQGNLTPKSAFFSHEMAQYGSMKYDPSYGRVFPGFEEWETAALKCIGIEYSIPALSGNPARSGIWITTPNLPDSRQTQENIIQNP